MTEKQAVLLIHGIGEQRPMETLRDFVEAVWTSDEDVKHKFATGGVWSKPDIISENFELRCLTTSKNCSGVLTDFYEFYWAHLMEGTMVSHVWAWVKCLLKRWPWNVPRHLLGAWVLLVMLVLVILFFFIQSVIPDGWRVIELPRWVMGLVGLLISVLAVPVIKNIIGDAARYLNPAPSNIKKRQEIRAKGVKLIQKLHEKGYQRIIIAGHSLGSVIGYDILTYAWALYNKSGDKTLDHPAMTALEDLVAGKNYDVDDYRSKQSDMLNEMVENHYQWRITDFVTLGSPLAHAMVLLAKDGQNLEMKKISREFPTCPPELEKDHFSYPPERVHRTPHHAAVFAPTRWTNLYFPSRFVIWGDFVGGPIHSLFGDGIKEKPLKTNLRWGLLSHTLYWKPGRGNQTASHILDLREALALGGPVPQKAAAEDTNP